MDSQANLLGRLYPGRQFFFHLEGYDLTSKLYIIPEWDYKTKEEVEVKDSICRNSKPCYRIIHVESNFKLRFDFSEQLILVRDGP